MNTTTFLINVLLCLILLMGCSLILLNDLVEFQSVQILKLHDNVGNSFYYFPSSISIPQTREIRIETRPDGSIVIKADFEAPQVIEADITILIKTMDKPNCLYNLVAKIRRQHPFIKIIIADDGMSDSSAYTDSTRNNVFYFQMPPDSGISAGRNLMLSQVQTKYVLILNDDLLWDNKILHHFLHTLQLHPHLDLVGGQSSDYSGLFHLDNDTLYLTKGNRGILEGTALPILTPRDPSVNYPEPVFSDMGPPCVLSDFVPPFFLARTDSLLKLQWDNNLKAGEQEEFFLRFAGGSFRAGYCEALTVENQKDKCNNKEETDIVAERNQQQRINRAHRYTRKGLYNHNISKLVYCLGDSLSSPSWPRVFSPISNTEPCYEVPLPEKQLYGDECHCSQHGKCKLRENVPWCMCEKGWFGPFCNISIPLGPNLIGDTNFLSLRRTDQNNMDQWQTYKDGCIRWADSGVWLMNDGHKTCGAFHTIEVSQTEPLTIVVSAESKGVGIAPLKDPSFYSISADLIFIDGTELKDQFVSFPEGTHAMQFKELILPATKAVKKVTVFVNLRVAGNAFFKSITVRQQTK